MYYHSFTTSTACFASKSLTSMVEKTIYFTVYGKIKNGMNKCIVKIHPRD